jgi:hypothetical protein
MHGRASSGPGGPGGRRDFAGTSPGGQRDFGGTSPGLRRDFAGRSLDRGRPRRVAPCVARAGRGPRLTRMLRAGLFSDAWTRSRPGREASSIAPRPRPAATDLGLAPPRAILADPGTAPARTHASGPCGQRPAGVAMGPPRCRKTGRARRDGPARARQYTACSIASSGSPNHSAESRPITSIQRYPVSRIPGAVARQVSGSRRHGAAARICAPGREAESQRENLVCGRAKYARPITE